MSIGGGSTSGGSTRAKRENWFIDRLRGQPGPGFGGEAGVLPYADQTFQAQAAQPINPTTQQGLQGIENLAAQGAPVGVAAQNVLLDILNKDAPQQGLAADAMQGRLTNPAMEEIRRIGYGGEVGGNPYLDARFEQAAEQFGQQFREQVVPGLDTAFGDAGRLGSGRYALMRNRAEEQAADTLGDMATNFYGNAYETDQNRRMVALDKFSDLGQQAINNRFTGAGVGNASTGQQLGAIGLGGQAFNLQAQPYSSMIDVGQMRDRAPWTPLNRYNNTMLANSTAGTSSTVPADDRNPIAGGLAGGLGAASIAAGMGATNPWIAGIGGVGALAGMLSDVRTKTDIKRVGKTDEGHGVYTYRYKGSDGPMMMGVMAQEVAQTRPDAVQQRPDGLMSVLYERLS